MSDYTVRPLAERDIESIIAIDALVTGEGGPERAGFWRGLLSIHLPESDEEAPPAIAHHLCQVAEASGPGGAHVVGFVIGDVQSWQFGLPRHGRVVTIGVHPDHRRKGVAHRLVDSLMAAFRKMGLPFVHCVVRPGDSLGAFFGSIGFDQPDYRILELTLGRRSGRGTP